MIFPEIGSIDDVLPHIKGRSDFAIKQGNGYVAIDYIFADKDTFDHPIRRECRGIKFDADTGQILARPYHKFFNVGEKPETQPDAIDWSVDHSVLEKLDGSMIHPAIVRGEVLFMTRAGVTSIAEDAGRHARRTGIIDECWALLNDGITPIFEWCSPRNQIVIRHESDALILTGLRSTISGKYHDISMSSLPDKVKAWGETVQDINKFLAHTKGLEDAEGYVVRFINGFMIKAKADAYVLRHKARDSTTLEKNVLRLVLEGAEDDVLPLLPLAEQDRLTAFSGAVRLAINSTAEDLARWVDIARNRIGDDRKRFALEHVATFPNILRGPAFNVWDGADPVEVITGLALRNCSSATSVESVRSLIGGARWEPGYIAEAA